MTKAQVELWLGGGKIGNLEATNVKIHEALDGLLTITIKFKDGAYTAYKISEYVETSKTGVGRHVTTRR